MSVSVPVLFVFRKLSLDGYKTTMNMHDFQIVIEIEFFFHSFLVFNRLHLTTSKQTDTHTRKSFFLEEMRENRCFDDAHCLFSLLLLERFLFNSNRSVQVFLSSSFDGTCLASVCLANNDLR